MKYIEFGHGYYFIREKLLGGFLFNKKMNKEIYGMGTVEYTPRRVEVLKRLGFKDWDAI